VTGTYPLSGIYSTLHCSISVLDPGVLFSIMFYVGLYVCFGKAIRPHQACRHSRGCGC